MSILLIKSVLLAIMTLVCMVFGILPIKMLKVLNDPNISIFHGKSSLIISLLSCFAGGVFLSVCFLDMLPDALSSWQSVQTQWGVEYEYPFVLLITLTSFFLVYIFEDVSALCCEIEHNDNDDAFVSKSRARFATVGSLFNMDGTIVKPRSDSIIPEKDAPIVKSIVFIAAFLLHVFLESFAFGVQENLRSTTSLFIGIIVHKAIVMFSIGMKLTRNHPRRWWVVVLLVSSIALCNATGGVIGIVIESSNMNLIAKDLCTSILMSVSLGTFLFISFFEMLGPERNNQHSNILQWISAVLGFALIAGIMAI